MDSNWDGVFRIQPKERRFETREDMEKFLQKRLAEIDTFTGIRCKGNSYDYSACEYIAELIREKSSEAFAYADFSDMFEGREEEAIPESLRPMLEAVCIGLFTKATTISLKVNLNKKDMTNSF